MKKAEFRVLDSNALIMFTTTAGVGGISPDDIRDIVEQDYEGKPYSVRLGDWTLSSSAVEEIRAHDERAVYAALNTFEDYEDFMFALRNGYRVFVGTTRQAASWWLDGLNKHFFVENFRSCIDTHILGVTLIEKQFLISGSIKDMDGKQAFVLFE
jgi:hypothetical protein